MQDKRKEAKKIMTDQDNGKIKKVSRGELDDFWDIDKLLPDSAARRLSPRPARAPGATAAVDIDVPPTARARVESAPSDGVETPAGGDNRHTVSGSVLTAGTHYVPPHADEERSGREPLSDYCPGGVLIHRVKVYAWNSNFHYFDQFAKDAVFYDGLESPKSARPEGFFSYFPQYVQLGRRQVDWYLYWRGRVRAGVYPDTDYAYILLYIFELINLPVIDLDTTMPGLSINDFGDSIRFGANHSKEDEKDLSKVNFDIELYEAYARGFLEGAQGSLTAAELEYLPWGARLMTLECGIRFLTDYLDGDHYFRIHRPEHNLDRCRTQFKLVRDMEEQFDAMGAVIAKL